MYCYLDQDALIRLFDLVAANDLPQRKLGGRRVAVSVWHLVETANVKIANLHNLRRAVALANFIDALDPVWLLERRDLQRLDVAESFYDFVAIPRPQMPRLVARQDALAALNRCPPSLEFDIPSRTFVANLILRPDYLATFRESCDSDFKALSKLRSVSRGRSKIPALNQARVRAARRLVEWSMPSHTPAGIEIDHDLRAQYLAQVNPLKIPTIATEVAISQFAHEGLGKNDRNTFIDKFHLISALPNVDELVTDDHFFWQMYEKVKTTGHIKARLRKFDGFWADCLSSGHG